MKIISALTFFLVFATFGIAAEAPKEEKNFLQEMRTLSEARGTLWKAYKSYILIGMNNHYKNPKESLKNSVEAFDKALMEVKAYANRKDFLETEGILEEAENHWKQLKPLFLAQPDPKKIPEIDKHSMKMIAIIIHALNAMGSEEENDNWRYLERAQMAQNTAQRMATLYLDRTWEALSPERYEKMMKIATDSYEESVDLIKKSKYATPEIQKILQSANRDYLFFKMMGHGKNGIFIPTLIYKKASDMDRKMGECTTLIMKQIGS